MSVEFLTKVKEYFIIYYITYDYINKINFVAIVAR